MLIAIALIISVTVSIFAALQLNTRAQPPVSCTIRVVPSVDSVQICTNFVVDVNIEDFYEFPVYDYEFILAFPETQVEVVIAYDGDFLVEPVMFSYDDTTAGQVFCQGFSTIGGATGSGTLATIEFHCLGSGYTPFDLTMVYISDEGGNMYMPDTLIGASVDQWETPPAVVHLVPPTYTVPICIPFSVNVMVDDVADLHSFSLKLSYTNTAVVDCLDIEDGGFLPQPTTETHKLIDDVLGIIEFDLGTTQSYGVDGSGSIAKITFHCTGAGESLLNIDDVSLYDSQGLAISRLIGPSSRVIQIGYWEPVKLQHIVEWPYPYYLVDIPYPYMPLSYQEPPEGYWLVMEELTAKGYTFDFADGTASEVTMFIDEEEVTGTVTSWWSSNTLEDGTRACMLSYENEDSADPGMAMGFVTNLLPPEQVPEVDPYIIVNAMQYFFVRFYWYSGPIDIIPAQSPIISWSLWWYDSHHHPNWFWSPYYWWRTWAKAYYYPYVHPGDTVYPYWRPWWGWWWHWTYWRHWHWWSTYFPYDP